MARDRWLRTITKGATWFSIRFSFLLLVSYLFTGDIVKAGIISAVFYSAGIVMFLAHERLWNLTDWAQSDKDNTLADKVLQRVKGVKGKTDKISKKR